MDSVAKTRRGLIATILGLIAAVAGAAFTPAEIAAASPPSPRSTFPAHPSDAQRAASGPLDLRPPADFPSSEVPFPSPRRTAKSALIDEQPSALGTTGPRMSVMSRAEELTRRIHREGLPLARLWESHSALLSLGLNPRGKPGIWLIQKIP
jgi:hypothetical protein